MPGVGDHFVVPQYFSQRTGRASPSRENVKMSCSIPAQMQDGCSMKCKPQSRQARPWQLLGTAQSTPTGEDRASCLRPLGQGALDWFFSGGTCLSPASDVVQTQLKATLGAWTSWGCLWSCWESPPSTPTNTFPVLFCSFWRRFSGSCMWGVHGGSTSPACSVERSGESRQPVRLSGQPVAFYLYSPPPFPCLQADEKTAQSCFMQNQASVTRRTVISTQTGSGFPKLQARVTHVPSPSN